jgi:hypothetical protein
MVISTTRAAVDRLRSSSGARDVEAVVTAPTLWWIVPDNTSEGASMSHTTESARVVNVAAGIENTDRTAPVPDGRHQALAVLIGKWINEGNVHRSRLEIEGGVIRWIGDRTRCTVTMIDDGMTQVAHHESSADGVSWTASMDVTLRKVA